MYKHLTDDTALHQVQFWSAHQCPMLTRSLERLHCVAIFRRLRTGDAKGHGSNHENEQQWWNIRYWYYCFLDCAVRKLFDLPFRVILRIYHRKSNISENLTIGRIRWNFYRFGRRFGCCWDIGGRWSCSRGPIWGTSFRAEDTIKKR